MIVDLPCALFATLSLVSQSLLSCSSGLLQISARNVNSLRSSLRVRRVLCSHKFCDEPGLGGIQRRRVAQHRVIVVRHGETDWNKALRVQGSTNIPLNDKGVAQAEATALALVSSLLPAARSSLESADSKTTATGTPTTSSSNSVVTTIYSSPLVRAKATADAIARAISSSASSLGDGNNIHTVRVATADELKEWDLGVLEGLTKEAAMKQFPDDWRLFSQWANPYVSLDDHAAVPLAQGESMEQVRHRVVEFIDKIVLSTSTARQKQQQPKVVCIVTHGGVLGQILRHVVEQSQEEHNIEIGSERGGKVHFPRPGNACISILLLESDMSNSDVPPQWKIERWADTSHLHGDLAPVASDYNAQQQTQR